MIDLIGNSYVKFEDLTPKFILFAYILKEGFEYFLQYLNLQNLKKYGMSVPAVFEGHINSDILKKSMHYEMEKIRFGFVSSVFGNIITIIFIFGGILNLYNSWIVSLNQPFILSGLIFFIILSYANTMVSIPFSLYITFKIEKKYGFNTMTPKLWISDFVKSIILSSVITCVLVSAALFIVQSNPNYWWIWLWGFFLLFSLFMMYISPYVIEPLFNKFTPIEEQGFEERIKEQMKKAGIKVSRVFKMDASKRSRHTNAYFSGIGRVKRIILYDTLLQNMNHNEILAVLAHEGGHWKKKHILKMLIAAAIVSFVGIYISFQVIQTDILIKLFRITKPTFFVKMLLLGFIGSIISFPLTPIGSYISRRFEREADRFAYELTNDREAMVSTMIKLSKDNLSNLHPHPLYATFYYSHPPVVQRIEEIKKMS